MLTPTHRHVSWMLLSYWNGKNTLVLRMVLELTLSFAVVPPFRGPETILVLLLVDDTCWSVWRYAYILGCGVNSCLVYYLGLLAAAIGNMDGVSGYEGWRKNPGEHLLAVSDIAQQSSPDETSSGRQPRMQRGLDWWLVLLEMLTS